MLAAQYALKPSKKEFHGPAIFVAQGDPGRVQVQTVARQQQDLRSALAVLLARRHFYQTQRLLEDDATLFAAQPNHTVTHYTHLTGLLGQRAFFDDFEDGIVADTADKTRVRVDD